jgi:hypothetical protein
VHLCAVVQNTLRTVEITHLEAGDRRRASLDLSLFHDVGLRVDNNLHDRQAQVPQGIKNRGLAPRKIIDGGEM